MRYLKHAVSSEAVNVAFASIQEYYQLEKFQLSRSSHDAERVTQIQQTFASKFLLGPAKVPFKSPHIDVGTS